VILTFELDLDIQTWPR